MVADGSGKACTTRGGRAVNNPRIANRDIRVIIDRNVAQCSAVNQSAPVRTDRTADLRSTHRATEQGASVDRTYLRNFEYVGCYIIQAEEIGDKATSASPKIIDRYDIDTPACAIGNCFE